MVDAKQRIVHANQPAADVLGMRIGELPSSPLKDVLPQSIPDSIPAGSEPRTYKGWGPGGPQEGRPLSIEVYPIGEQKMTLLILQPGSEAEDPGSQPHHGEDKVKADALLEAIPDAIFIQDFNGNFLDYFPPRYPGFLPGRSEVMGRPMSDFLPEDVVDLFRKGLEAVRKERRVQKLEFQLSQEQPQFYEARLVPMNDRRALTVIREVTEQVKTQKALLAGQQQLRNYLDTAASMFVVVRPDFGIAMINKKACEALGYTRKQLIDRSVLTLFRDAPERKRIKLLIERTLEGKSDLARYFESTLTSRSGEKRLVRWRNALMRSPAGETTGLICSGVDITAQKAAEAQLVRSEGRNRAILEAIPDIILLHDESGKILSVQEAHPSTEYFGPESLAGKTVTEAFPDPVGATMLEMIRDSCRTGLTRIAEVELDGKNGKNFFEIRYVCMASREVLAVVRDITRTKATQQVLNLRNRALEAAGNGILIADARLTDLPVIYCNEAFQHITGYERNEVLGKNCRFLQGPDTDREKVREIREALQQGVACTVVLRNYRKDGRLFWNELTITPITDASGVVTHFIGVQNDVTSLVLEGERKDHTRKILEAITQDQPLKGIARSIVEFPGKLQPEMGLLIALWKPGKQHLEMLAAHSFPEDLLDKFEKIPLKEEKGCPCIQAVKTRKPVLLKDLQQEDGINPFVNSLKDRGFRSCWSYPILSSGKIVLGTCTFFGRKPGKPTGTSRGPVKDAIQLTALAIERYQTRSRLEQSNRKLERYAKDLERDVEARTREVESTVQKLMESNRSLQMQIRTTRKAEQRAMASREMFRVIAQNFPKGVIMVVDRELEYVHLEGEELERMGLKDWQYSGCSVMDTPGFPSSRLMELRTRIHATLEGKHLSFELELHQYTYSVHTTLLSSGTDMGWALLVFSNVTEHKRAEEELRKALRAEQELNDLKSRFISMASHEFRTPLSAIHSSAILIGKQNEPGKEEKRLRYLKQIKNNVRNLVVILNDFLSLGKMEEGRIEYQPVEFDLLELIRSVLEEMEGNLKVGQHFREDFEHTILQVTLDPKLMRHILVNLLSNAIKYSPENSGIFIHIRTGSGLLKISIQDEGMGVPMEEQPQLFNRFFRARNALNIPGTGLGLHIVKHYTELMGGHITFESQPDAGSTFYLQLPIEFKSDPYEEDTDH